MMELEYKLISNKINSLRLAIQKNHQNLRIKRINSTDGNLSLDLSKDNVTCEKIQNLEQIYPQLKHHQEFIVFLDIPLQIELTFVSSLPKIEGDLLGQIRNLSLSDNLNKDSEIIRSRLYLCQHDIGFFRTPHIYSISNIDELWLALINAMPKEIEAAYSFKFTNNQEAILFSMNLPCIFEESRKIVSIISINESNEVILNEELGEVYLDLHQGFISYGNKCLKDALQPFFLEYKKNDYQGEMFKFNGPLLLPAKTKKARNCIRVC